MIYSPKLTKTMNEELDSISILKSYVESIDELARWDMQLAQELSYRIIQYWIKWVEPPVDASPYMMSPFKQIKRALDKGRSKWKCAKKDSDENETESNENQNEIKSESNEIKWKSNEIKLESNDDKKKSKSKSKNVITLSNDNEEKLSYWNDDINKCLELIKTYNNGIVDWTQQNQRRFAKHLINKLNWLENVKKGKFTRYETLDILLKIISQNKFYCTKITSPEKIYRELGTLMSVCKKDIQDKSTESIVLETL